ncbi:MAG: hypothetical protein A3C50_01645 [Candidatus Staskawiczbacteria bacterium RIFCSPHIGHO2_02_FULL_43_16]|uniref:Phosphoglycerate mutase n=1 Tax=Candidatus Staskawiczbacteria bacterium RIFCSPHIGHO2_01_FULL_41_41 TaxID=1802203 RepID=A0A1G2HUN1_9BACT|nr:MAG: hypothetical protein A2822_04060 [Candidatus Staskawiczbacteria bacterium RIFCSPHIGHO2_01_FULL_41_41]OGZ69083.1 MAG: hypothetical protein A3C50_01645 [Candidatus Staskawiczbacteria bacterium RIFCSPHIGHO2_02_FULL_43_16]OGZ74491.1 MAG: hypothetical protein A3A12_01850 [Candidatus Staskawiczbacteria bacterium RIFCSPLOWO2_01_FULL_43_17b]
MKVIIVRHAKTNENAQDRLAIAKSNILLNEEGVKQAEKLGHYLKGHRISHAYSGPLKRAVHTAEKILQHHPDAQLIVSDHLNEQNLGVAETMPKAVWKEMKKKSTDPWHLFKEEKGESYRDMQARVAKFFHELIAKHGPNDTILMVSHGGTLGVLLLHILKKELTEENYRAHQPKNTEFTIVEISEDGQKKIHDLNSNKHLN